MLGGIGHILIAGDLSDKTHEIASCQLVDSLLSPQMCVLGEGWREGEMKMFKHTI